MSKDHQLKNTAPVNHLDPKNLDLLVKKLEENTKIRSGGTIKMNYKFSSLPMDLTKVNSVVEELGSVENFFESPEYLAGLLQQMGSKSLKDYENMQTTDL